MCVCVCVCMCVCVYVCVCVPPFTVRASLSRLHTRSGQTLDYTSVRLAFNTEGLHLPLSGIALALDNTARRSILASGTHERGRNVTVKD